MELTQEIERILSFAVDECRRRSKSELERFARALQRWFDTVLPRLAPEHIERELYRFLTVWDGEGIQVSPESYLELVARLKERQAYSQDADSLESAPGVVTPESSPNDMPLGGPGEVTLGTAPGADDAARAGVPTNVEEALEELYPREPPPDDFTLGPKVAAFAKEHPEVWAEFSKTYGAGESGGGGRLKRVLGADWKIYFEPIALANGYWVHVGSKRIIISIGVSKSLPAVQQAASLYHALEDIETQRFGLGDKGNALAAIREAATTFENLEAAIAEFADCSESDADPNRLSGLASRIDVLHAQFEAALIAAMRAHLRYSKSFTGTGVLADDSLLRELFGLPVLIDGLPVSRQLLSYTQYYSHEMAEILSKANQRLDRTITIMERTKQVADTIQVLGGPAVVAQKLGQMTVKEGLIWAATELLKKEATDKAFDLGMGVVEYLGGREAAETVGKIRRGIAAYRAYRDLRGAGLSGSLGFAAGRKHGGGSSTRPAKSVPAKGIYEFPDKKSGGLSYVGQSGNLPQRLKKHRQTGRLAEGTVPKTTEIQGDATAREVAEHQRIQELTGGVPASKSGKVANRKDPIGKRRRTLLEGHQEGEEDHEE